MRVCGTQENHFALREFYTNTHTWMRHIQRARTPICSCGLSESYNHDCDMFEFWSGVFQFGTCSITSCFILLPSCPLAPYFKKIEDWNMLSRVFLIHVRLYQMIIHSEFPMSDQLFCTHLAIAETLTSQMSSGWRVLLMSFSPLQVHWKPTCFPLLILGEEGCIWKDWTAHMMELYLTISQTNMNKSCLIFEYVISHTRLTMGWLRSVGLIKL